MFCVGISPAGLIEADAPPASDKAPATPNAVTTLLRPLPFEVCFERDIVATSLWLIAPNLGQKQFGAALRPVQALSLLQQLRQLGDVGGDPRASSRVSSLPAVRRPDSQFSLFLLK